MNRIHCDLQSSQGFFNDSGQLLLFALKVLDKCCYLFYILFAQLNTHTTAKRFFLAFITVRTGSIRHCCILYSSHALCVRRLLPLFFWIVFSPFLRIFSSVSPIRIQYSQILIRTACSVPISGCNPRIKSLNVLVKCHFWLIFVISFSSARLFTCPTHSATYAAVNLKIYRAIYVVRWELIDDIPIEFECDNLLMTGNFQANTEWMGM